MKSKRPSLADLQASIRSQAPAGWVNAGSKNPLTFMDKTPRAPRKEGVKNDHQEHNDQTAIVSYLRRCCPSVVVSASLNGEIWPMSQHVPKGVFFGWINKLKGRGMLTGEADLNLTWSPSRIVYIEMKKTGGGKTSEAQKGVGELRRAMGFPVYVLDTGIDGLREIIAKEGIPCLER